MKKIKYLMAVCLFCTVIFSVTAWGQEKAKEAEVVFLLDTSNSMNSQDKYRLAADGIRQAAYSFPSSYQFGFVSYNTSVQGVAMLSSGYDQLEAQLGAVRYTGYTNAGDGLSQAMGLFSDREGVERYIIMISDGEIIMGNRQATDTSRALYVQAANLAKEKGVKIYIAAIGNELDDPQMHIFDGAEITDGAVYWEGQAGSLTEIIDRIMIDRIGFPGIPLGVTDAGGGRIHVEVPAPGADRLKILLTSPGKITAVTADYEAETGRVQAGARFAAVDIGRPAGETVNVDFKASDLSGVRAYMICEYQAEPAVDISYRREEVVKESDSKALPPEYTHYADIVIRMADTEGKNDNLWNVPYYEGKEIPFSINGTSLSGQVHGGVLEYSMQIDGVEQLKIQVDTNVLDEVYYISQPSPIDLSIPPDPVWIPEPEPDYRPLWIIMGILAAAVIIIVILWVKKSRTTLIYVAQAAAAKDPYKKVETKNCEYTGKLNMYVVRTKDGRDIPPQTFRLFGRKSGRVTLDWILTSCGIKFGKIGAEDIIFYPGPDKDIIVMDQSERCTVMRGSEILKKGMGYPVYMNEKVTVSFDDEATEMEIHYKNLKPSERES